MNPYLDRCISVIDHHLTQIEPKMKWMWGEALFGYALLCLDEYLGETKYKTFIEGYLDYYLQNPPVVDQSDKFAPVLISFTYGRIYQTNTYDSLTQLGLDYIENVKPVIDFLPNHLGHSFIGKLYPKSIWVDSIMMYGVFLSVYGHHHKSQKYQLMAYNTAIKFKEYLEKDGLWRHAYWVKFKRAYPKDIYWGRGNGWVVTALPMMMEHLDTVYQMPLKDLAIKTIQAITPLQKNHLYTTVLNHPSGVESSANFLIHGGVLHTSQLTVIDEAYTKLAKKGYEIAMDTFVKPKEGHLYLTKVSNPTIPLPLFPLLGYKLIGHKDNWSYGLASLIFSSIHYDKLRIKEEKDV